MKWKSFLSLKINKKRQKKLLSKYMFVVALGMILLNFGIYFGTFFSKNIIFGTGVVRYQPIDWDYYYIDCGDKHYAIDSKYDYLEGKEVFFMGTIKEGAFVPFSNAKVLDVLSIYEWDAFFWIKWGIKLALINLVVFAIGFCIVAAMIYRLSRNSKLKISF